jgi:2,4-dienoyl-CoA reductase-like NADH-dependent reductase (Old Yellow Enzyme family)
VPLILVGGLRSPDVIEEVLTSGAADLVAMSRPLIREPDLPERWRRGDHGRAGCVSCLGCFRPAGAGEGIRCVRSEPSG